MAAKVGGIVGQASRFAIIAPADSDSDQDENWHKVAKKPSKGSGKSKKNDHEQSISKAAAKNAKRRAKKRNQESSSSDQLIDDPSKYSDWLQKDQVLVEKEFENNLKTALLNSMLETGQASTTEVPVEEPSRDNDKVKSKPKKGVTLSLQDFHNSDFSPQLQHPTAVNGSVTEKDDHSDEVNFFVHAEEKLQTEVQKSLQLDRRGTSNSNGNSSKKKKAKENGGSSTAGSSISEPVRIAQLKDDLEKKDAILSELREDNDRLKEELKEVKVRNQVLYKMLSRGEISSKSELLQQLEDLSLVKTELSAEVERLHAELEQERSRNKILMKSELSLAKTQSSKPQ